ncbi:MAG: HemK2/MTQ2 family protein methyltransferase [Candidatus Hecatellaceae archaeon]
MKIRRLYGFLLKIPSHVYEPSDDSFLLAENLKLSGGETVLDMGCGSGLLTLLAARKASLVVAVDINPEAVKATAENVKANGFAGKVELVVGDLFSAFRRGELFDLVIFNPPYLPVEEEDQLGRAWSGGPTGREVIDRFLSEVKGRLKPRGKILLVQSTLSNVSETVRVLEASGFNVRVLGRKQFFFEELFCLEAELTGCQTLEG